MSEEPAAQGVEAERTRLRDLERQAEALERQADGLSHQNEPIAIREAELNAAIDRHKVEISLLISRLKELQEERGRLLDRAESLRKEAAAVREQAFECEAEIALSALEDRHLATPVTSQEPQPGQSGTESDQIQAAPVPTRTAHNSPRAY
jgi:chromosome segregation ATPase